MMSFTFSPWMLKALDVLSNEVSSAYTIDLNMLHAFDMSFVNMIKNKGPMNKPWRTSMIMFAREDLTLLNSKNCLRSNNYIRNFLVELDRQVPLIL